MQPPDRTAIYAADRTVVDAGRRRLARDLLLVVAFTLLVTLPFIFKPFHMDDDVFLRFAGLKRDNPMSLELQDFTFYGKDNAAFFDTHPPLVPDYIALLNAIRGGESEPFLHLGFLIFPLIAAVSMYFLAREFTRHSLVTALLLMATPGVMVMSHGLLTDMPGMSLWVASVTLYIYGIKRKSLALMVLCGIAMALGVFISYQLLSVIPLLLVYALIRRKFNLLAIIPFVLPLSAMASYAIWHLLATGYLPRISYGDGRPLAWFSLIQKASSVVLTLAAATIFFLVLYRVFIARKNDFLIYMIFLVPLWISIMFQYMAGEYTLLPAILLLLFMPLGIMFLARIYSSEWGTIRAQPLERSHTSIFLLVWLSGVLFYVVVLLPYSSARYLLPIFPPLVLMFVRFVEAHFGERKRQMNQIFTSALVLTAILGLLVAYSDYEYARANYRFATHEARSIGEQAAEAGHKVWIVGEFGYRYYMEQEGFTELSRRTHVEEGDIIIQSPLADWRKYPEELDERMELVETIAYYGWSPLKVTNHYSRAGFYGSHWGLLPYSITTGPIEEYLVFRVGPELEDEDDAGLWLPELKNHVR